ncbi:formate dehydrogenase accessory sulfurtransferase FdhD [Celeribacter indicus]|uniref:Formate dehydrogenase family accessory protein FdhD n=1 Tax=Celeribacter indicus TaxID=1208324 RepID=A0A0B5E1C4_9RHOB|nr:formate dehydrogenase accessory sulfurtransferase FdhD [Celeribacter indicus]AJE46262.1 formate dehydrogenase family accessory protein FdhD [Celeribacter indicus]SDW51486.1 FdhD protein [Celeribacter indicus]
MSAAEALPDEVPVALVYNGSTAAVMMASPFDLPDFLRGFALSEGIVARAEDVTEVSELVHPQGREVRGRIPEDRAGAMDARRRASVGPMGCGLCGIDSLAQAAAFPGHVDPMAKGLEDHARAALDALNAGQTRREDVGAMHAAGFFDAGGLIALREDVGRHNALDKLIGALSGRDLSRGAALVTSRLSVDLVQKCARSGIRGLFALSSPTRAAVELARACGMTLCVIRREAVVRYAGEGT